MDRVTMLDAGEKTAAAPPSLFHRRIEFLPAKRLFTGFRNGGGGFRLETLNPKTSDPNIPGGSGEGIGRATSGKRPDRVEASELARDPEFSFGFNLMKIGAGLENLGNTCFLNSVLQCLTYTEPLAAYLQSGRHRSSCRKAGFCALCAIQNHVSRALQLTGRSLAPKDLVSNLRCISRNFRNARQEDAHEYMVNLLESMHKCCLPSGVPSGSPSAFEKSLVHEIFGGRLRSQVKCMQCSFCSDKFDPFLDLSLEINKADSLHKALAHFTAKEYLDGGAREYQCQRCKQKVKALKQLSVHKAPYVLNIHLKRFSCHQPGQKIDKKVHFGSTLDLKPFVSGAYDGDLKYTLYGVLVHYGGNTHSGHYYCFVRTSSGMWYSLDDHRVCHVSEKRVLEEKAYMLFYVRDRKNVIPKKTVDVGHAKSMIINALGNRMQSESNRVPNKPFQNGAADKRVESLHPSPSLARVDVAVASALKETVTKGKSIQGSVQETVSVSTIGEDCSKQSPIIANGSIGGPSNVAFVTTGIKINERNKGRSTKNGPIDSVVASPKSDCLQSSVSKNYPSEVVNTPKSNQEEEKNTSDSSSVKLDCIGIHSSSVELRIKESIVPKGCEEKASKTVNPSSQVKEQRHVNIEIGVSSKESTAIDSGKELEPVGLVSASINIPQKAPAHKRQRKLKKKFSQSRITLTRLSSGIILGAAFGVRKKIQKKKKFKQSALKIDIPTQEHLGPSTSEPTRPLVSTCNSQRKRSKVSSSKREKISNVKNGNIYDCNLVMGVTNEKLRDRAGQTEAAVAADKPPEGISSYPLARNGTASREDNILKETRRDSSQNAIMNMLTRGLGETIVAQWDEIEHHSSHLTGTSGDEPVSIGYIGDDWDEEYDKGKRKKVRTSVRDFGGPNPFQEIANQKAKLKRAKLDRFSSANQPFRI